MMKKLFSLLTILMMHFDSISQNVDFVEYDLDNGLHVILHQDKSVPLAVTSVMYHVGSKDDSPDRTGFAHFFEQIEDITDLKAVVGTVNKFKALLKPDIIVLLSGTPCQDFSSAGKRVESPERAGLYSLAAVYARMAVLSRS